MGGSVTNDDDRNWSNERLLETYEEALDLLDEYEATVAIHAKRGRNPHAQEDVQEAHVWLHLAVMRVWRRMPRRKIQNRLENYWKGIQQTGTDENGNPEYEAVITIYEIDGEEYYGLQWLDALQGKTYSQTVRQRRRHEGIVEQEQWEAQLLPPEKCRRCINLFGEILEELGYIDPPDPPKVVSVLDAQGGDGDALGENGGELPARPDGGTEE